MHIQVRIPAALAAIHNFIGLRHREKQDLADSLNGIHSFDTDGRQDLPEPLMTDASDAGQIQRATIAQLMWDDYQRALQEQADIDGYLYSGEDEEVREGDDDYDEDDMYSEDADNMV